jgi:hypothetical protein
MSSGVAGVEVWAAVFGAGLTGAGTIGQGGGLMEMASVQTVGVPRE